MAMLMGDREAPAGPAMTFSKAAERVPFWIWLNVFSLDAALVAVLWQALLGLAFHKPVDARQLLVLALSVWVIYTGDHILDARHAPTSNKEPERKRFFRSQSRAMAIAAVLGFVLTVFLAWFYLRPAILLFGFAGGLLIGVYFSTVHLMHPKSRRIWPREAIVAVLFTAGVFAPVALALPVPSRFALAASALPFSVLCWANCCAVEIWDWRRGGRCPEEKPGASARWALDHLGLLAFSSALLVAVLFAFWHLPPPIFASLLCSSGCFMALAKGKETTDLPLLCHLIDIALCSPALVMLCLWLR